MTLVHASNRLVKICQCEIPDDSLEAKVAEVQKILIEFPEAAKNVDVYKRTPMHYAMNYPTAPMKILEELVKASPDAAKVMDYRHRTPLHNAVSDSRVPLDAVKLIVEACPEAVKISERALPLHDACRLRPNDTDLIIYLMEKFPEAVTLKEECGYLPVHFIAIYSSEDSFDSLKVLLEANPETISSRTTYSDNLVHCLVKGMHPHQDGRADTMMFDQIEYVADLRPEALLERNFSDCLPIDCAVKRCMQGTLPERLNVLFARDIPALHFLCRYGATLDTIKKIFDTPGLMKGDTFYTLYEGQTPLHSFCSLEGEMDKALLKFLLMQQGGSNAVQTPSDDGEYALHCACNTNQNEEVLMTLLKAYPEAAAKTPKNEKKYPVHHICKKGMFSSLMLIMEQAPSALAMVDADGMLPLHWAVLNPEIELNMVFSIIQRSPNSIGDVATRSE